MIVLNTRYQKLVVGLSLLLMGYYFYLFKNRSCPGSDLSTGLAANIVNGEGSEVHPCIDFWVRHGSHDILKVWDIRDEEPDEEVIVFTRNYNQCFIKLQNALPNLKCNPELEARMYPWMTQKSPNITTADGVTKKLFDINPDQCFLNQLKSQLSGRGLVLSATTFHFKELTRLVILLRALNTKIPLQIVHRNDIHVFNQQKLFELATADISDHPKFFKLLESFKGSSTDLPESTFPPLNLSFVDIRESVKEEYAWLFERFSNKLLAYLFNSFEDMILMDVDTVPLIPVEDFFQFEEYLDKGAFFFKDRSLLNGHEGSRITDIFLDIMPKKDDLKFGIKPITNFTLNQHFLNPGFAHLMESGLVIVNRLKHFDNALMTITLDRFKITIMQKIHGDKELYWLAMSVSGDEDYHFNENFAASIGEITQFERSHFPEAGDKIQEICSNHPAHIAKDNKTLLWMNTGFAYCKKIMHMDDSNPFFKGWSDEEVDEYNKGPMTIKAAIIPPVPKTPGLLMNVPSAIPDRGWISRPYCESYTVCAYDRVGDSEGIVVRFSEKEQEYFYYLGQVWFNSMELLKEISEKVMEQNTL